MIRSSLLLWMFISVGASGLLYHTSYQVQAKDRQLANINASIEETRQAIRVLKAEQAYLSAPARLERLARNDLSMGPITPQQVKSAKQFFATPDTQQVALLTPSKVDASPRPEKPMHFEQAHSQFILAAAHQSADAIQSLIDRQ